MVVENGGRVKTLPLAIQQLSEDTDMIALYHSHPEMMEFTAEVVSCVPSREEGCFDVILSNTAFYPTGGGQPCDLGTINGHPVVAVEHEDETLPIVHTVRCSEPLTGDVTGVIDENRRRDHTQQHSGQHLLSHVLYERFGAYSLGLHIGAQDSYVDVKDEGNVKLTREVCDEMEQEINAWIARDEIVKCFFPTDEELQQLPLRKKPDVHESLRIVCIGKDEAVACCGTHVRSTAQVQMVHILSWQQSHGNLRIFFVAGLRAVNYAVSRIAQADAAAKLFSCSVNDVVSSIERLKAANIDLARQLAEVKKQLVLGKLSALKAEEFPKGHLYLAHLEGADDAQLKEGISAITKADPMALCFLTAPAGAQFAAAMGAGAECKAHAGNVLRAVLTVLGGKGGGRPDSAFGRCSAWDETEARKVLTEQLS